MPRSRSSRCGRRARRAFANVFEQLEGRQMFCLAHETGFRWTDPNSPISLASGRATIASLYDLTTPTSTAALTARAETNATGIPILNSNPGAPAEIYLDFDGDAGGTYPGVNTVQMVTPYDTNGDPDVFDAAEASVITQAWTYVSTYFAMFNVNVTTGTPTKPFAWNAIGNNVGGGYSFVGVFPQNLAYHPLSFENSEMARSRATGIAHEVGHNFGLNHQADWDDLGRLLHEYSSGYDDQHGPFMGVDFAQKFHKWILGHPSTSATYLQDDLAIIAGRIANVSGGGDGYRVDDAGNSIASATPTIASGLNQIFDGVIERRTDVDVFSFTSTGGRYLVSVNQAIESSVDLKIEVRDGNNKLLASEDLSSNDAQIAIDLPAGTFYASVASHGNYGDLGQYNLVVSPLAAGFDSSDVSVLSKRAGSASFDASTGIWDIRGAGNDVWNSADQFRYVYQQLSGDGSITARVLSLGNTGTYAKAGLMIRESLGAGSRHGMVNVRADNAVEFIRRNNTDTNAVSDVVAGVSSPLWLRLTRVGNTLTAERSTDGTNWVGMGSQTVAMGANVYIGLAVNANNEGVTTLGRFDNVTTTGAVGAPTYADNGLPAPAVVLASMGTGTGLNVNWTAVSGATGYVLERSTDGMNFTQILVTTADQPRTYADVNLPGSARYYYRVTATNGAPGRGVARIGTAINRASAVTNVTTMSINTNIIQIDWRDTTGETGYRVERSNDNGATWTAIATLDVNVNGYTDTGVTANNNYRYRVIPLAAAGEGPASASVIEGSRFSAVANVKVVKSTSNALTLNWTDTNKAETGYKIEHSLDNITWSTLGTVGGDTLSYVDTGLTSLTPYYYRVTAFSAYTEGIAGGLGFGATRAQAPNQLLPNGWGGIDIGAVGGPGANGFASATGTYTLIASGEDIWGTADSFHFTYRRMSGDGEIYAQVASLENVDQYTKAGVMFRESLAPDSRYAFANMTPRTTGVQFERRTQTGGNPLSNNGFGGSVPIWVRLVRAGDTFTAYRSIDGSDWTSMGSQTIAMGTTIYVGLALSAHNNSRLGNATFTNVGGSATTQVDTIAPAVPALTMSTDTGISATDFITNDNTPIFSGTAEPGSTLTLKRNGTPIATIVVDHTGTWQFEQTTPMSDGTYFFNVGIVDVSGNSSPTASRTVVIDTAAPTVSSISFDRETAHVWTIRFSQDVNGSVSASDFSIVNTTTLASVTPVMTYDAATRTATLTLAEGAYLANSRYELRLAAGAVTDQAGNATLVATALPTNILAGDLNDSGAVDFDDLLILARNYGTSGRTYSEGNIDYDAGGNVGFDDLLALARAYGTQLPPAASPASATLASASRRRATATFGDGSIIGTI